MTIQSGALGGALGSMAKTEGIGGNAEELEIQKTAENSGFRSEQE